MNVLFTDYYLALHSVEAFECFLKNYLFNVVYFDYFFKEKPKSCFNKIRAMVLILEAVCGSVRWICNMQVHLTVFSQA